jgi:hypothetical protein
MTINARRRFVMIEVIVRLVVMVQRFKMKYVFYYLIIHVYPVQK